MIDVLRARGPYLLYVMLVVLGVTMILTHRSLFKALAGLALAQSGIILFFIALAYRTGGSLPVLAPDLALPLVNPLPHALMLTAIVVGVATLGLGIVMLQRLQEEEGSIGEPSAEER